MNKALDVRYNPGASSYLILEHLIILIHKAPCRTLPFIFYYL